MAELLAGLLADVLLAELGEDMVVDAQVLLQHQQRNASAEAGGSGEGGSDDTEVESFSETEDDDTTASQLSQGRDMQGIPWDRLQFSREHYRETRLRQYRNYTNLLPEDTLVYRPSILATCTPKSPQKTGRFFDFAHNSRAAQSNIVHFQLRNLVWTESRNDVFLTHENCINHFNPATGRITEVLNLAGGGQPAVRGPQGMERVQISTLCMKQGILAAGGFGGELVYKRLGEDVTDSTIMSGRVTQSENGITNGIEIFDSHHGISIMAANNDAALRVFDAEGFKLVTSVDYPWAVNFAAMRPHSQLAAVVGDDPITHLTDINSGMTVTKLSGHHDFSFAAAWHPNGNMLATGNQDTTTMVWDIRNPSTPLAILAGRMGAIRSVRFSPDGRFLAMAEPADFVHIYDVASGFTQLQEVDIFGEISGISFTPLTDAFFVAIADITYSSLIEFERFNSSDTALGEPWTACSLPLARPLTVF